MATCTEPSIPLRKRTLDDYFLAPPPKRACLLPLKIDLTDDKIIPDCHSLASTNNPSRPMSASSTDGYMRTNDPAIRTTIAPSVPSKAATAPSKTTTATCLPSTTTIKIKDVVIGRGDIFAIGHSTRTMDDFMALLRRHGIRRLVDIRSKPHSSKYPHFSQGGFRTSLAAQGVSYAWCPGLGGFRKGEDVTGSPWQNKSFANYATYALTSPVFAESLEWLVETACEARSAIMCAESNHYKCHRRIVSDALVARAIPVWHIASKSTLRPHLMTPGCEIVAVNHTPAPRWTRSSTMIRQDSKIAQLLPEPPTNTISSCCCFSFSTTPTSTATSTSTSVLTSTSSSSTISTPTSTSAYISSFTATSNSTPTSTSASASTPTSTSASTSSSSLLATHVMRRPSQYTYHYG